MFAKISAKKELQKKIKRTTLSAEDYEAKYVIVVLSRGGHTDVEYHFSKNEVDATDHINLR